MRRLYYFGIIMGGSVLLTAVSFGLMIGVLGLLEWALGAVSAFTVVCTLVPTAALVGAWRLAGAAAKGEGR